MAADEPRHSGTLFNEFQFVPAEHVMRMIFSSLNKSCDGDIISTDIVKECIDDTSYYQLSLAWLTCLLTLARSKTSGRRLYWGQLKKDYRAVSNLTFLSKVTEKVVDQQLSHHMSSFNCILSLSQRTESFTVRKRLYYMCEMKYWWIWTNNKSLC